MRFTITRTSCRGYDTKPCDEAVSETVDGEQVWYIKVNSLDELVALARKYDEIIINGRMRLEIYDSYRE